MDVAFKSTLNQRELKPVRQGDALRILLVYADVGIVNGAMELLRSAARQVEGPGWLLCAICHFDVLVDPLLKRIAAKEATAAEMVVIAALQGKSLPNTVKDWATRWISIKMNVQSALASILVGEEWTACSSPFVPLRFESLGRFDKIDLFTIGCGEGAGMALKTELRCTLAGRSKESAEMVPGSTLLGEAARGKECLRRSAPAFSGWPQSALSIDTSQSKILLKERKLA